MVRVLDHYGLLGIPVDSQIPVIKKVYKTLALKHHPDKNPDNINAQKNFQMLQNAYAVLIDISARKAYDRARTSCGVTPTNFLPSITKEGAEEEARYKTTRIAEGIKLAQEERSRILINKIKLEREMERERTEKARLDAEHLNRLNERLRAAKRAKAEQDEFSQKYQNRLREERLAAIAAAAEKLRAVQAKGFQKPGMAWQQNFYQERWAEDERNSAMKKKVKREAKEKLMQEKQERENMERLKQQEGEGDWRRERANRMEEDERQTEQKVKENVRNLWGGGGIKGLKKAEEDMSKWWEEEMDNFARERAEKEKRENEMWNRTFQADQDVDMKDYMEEDESPMEMFRNYFKGVHTGFS